MPKKKTKPAAPADAGSIHDRILQADFANIAKKVKAGRPLTKAERELVERQKEDEGRKEGAPLAMPVLKKELGVAPNMAAAAARTGLSEATIKRVKSAGCTAWAANGNVDCDAVLKFCAEHPDLLEEDESALNREREETLRIRADRIWRERRNQIQDDEYVLRAEVGQRLNSLCMAQRALLETVITDDAILTQLCRDMRKFADEWNL